MSARREYPDAPRVGVGAVVLDGERVVLIRRGRPPGEGRWSLPGGLVDLGEGLEDAVVREVREECGLQVRVLGLCGVVDRIFRDEAGPGAASRVRYHWVILDYAAEVLAGALRAGSDAAEARWVPLGDLGRYDLVAGIAEMVDRAVALRRAEAPAGGGSGS